MVLPAQGAHRPAPFCGHPLARDDHPRRSSVAFTAMLAGPAAPACRRAAHPSHCTNHFSSGQGQSVFRVRAPGARLLEDLRCALQDCGLSHSVIDGVLDGTPPYLEWQHCKAWCLEPLTTHSDHHPLWTCIAPSEFDMQHATFQLADFLGDRAQVPGLSHGHICNCRSAFSTAVGCLFDI